ncbi:MAG: helix-turn-helix domain-containing protein [Acidobacteria bacterium]|nr:helix-turn-helix domain-containing protein [Acidobacteriota bacterium]MBW4044318.1 helix-turn-helix domain-containing protein [Acidobacteriota bacterium]
MNHSETRIIHSADRGAPTSASYAVSTTDSPFSLLERLYSAQEVAERLGVSERWIRDHATRRNPRIRAVKLGPLLRFREADIASFVASQTTPTPRGARGIL